MKSQEHRIHIRKEALKFSVAHMTVFPDGSKESLHGHNYSTEVSIQLKDIAFQGMISFSEYKQAMKAICELWDEKVLLPSRCPFIEIKAHSLTEIEFILCGKRYVLPADEVVLLDLENITTETLAFEFAQRLCKLLDPFIKKEQILAIDVRVDESPGQGATYSWKVV
jgi:6-pyruvoyltetrahydropterin/6-carboxytetrahydropterin synthase